MEIYPASTTSQLADLISRSFITKPNLKQPISWIIITDTSLSVPLTAFIYFGCGIFQLSNFWHFPNYASNWHFPLHTITLISCPRKISTFFFFFPFLNTKAQSTTNITVWSHEHLLPSLSKNLYKNLKIT